MPASSFGVVLHAAKTQSPARLNTVKPVAFNAGAVKPFSEDREAISTQDSSLPNANLYRTFAHREHVAQIEWDNQTARAFARRVRIATLYKYMHI
jgi:hypothetical protein